MINIKYANAYSELLEILKYLSIEDNRKLNETVNQLERVIFISQKFV